MLIHSLSQNISQKIKLTGSKSISNRLLILNSLFNNKINLINTSNSEDTNILKKSLTSKEKKINIGHAGTAMRFLVSFFAYKGIEKIITGSSRMKKRPIGLLVEALRSIGVEIKYLEEIGFPPIKILPSKFNNNKLKIKGNISSQFITSLLLIAPKLPNGLELELTNKITSFPYLNMTLSILNKLGIFTKKNENFILIKPIKKILQQNFIIESDWSSASYYYSIAAVSKNCNLELSYFFKNSLQGDSKIVSIYKNFFGVYTKFIDNKIILTKDNNFDFPKSINLNLNDSPDIAQTIAVTSALLKIPTLLTGLETLKVKETDRIVALYKELKKCGIESTITNSTINIQYFNKINYIPKIETYEDHRMAMAFSPFSLIHPIEIINSKVVKKSYPNFWKDINKLGIKRYK